MPNLLDAFNRSLELIILPTEECNFRCVYCYEDFKIKRMSSVTVNAIKRLLDQRAGELESLKLQWFGGEPLLAMDIIEDISSYALRLRDDINNKMGISGYATTNGSLLDRERLGRLVALGTDSFQITLDGDREEHNRLRVGAGGLGTFDVVWKNILDAHRSDLKFNIIIRLHVNSDNEESMRHLLDRIRDEIGTDSRFSIFIRKLAKLGGKNDDVLPISYDVDTVERLREYAISLGLRPLGYDVYKRDFGYVCYAAKPNSYVIRANGDVSKCTVALYNDFNIVGHLNSNGRLELDRDKIMGWSRGIFNRNKRELECPLHDFPLKRAVSEVIDR